MQLIDKLVTREEDLIQPKGNLIIEPVSEEAHILGAAIQLEQINTSGIWWDIDIEPEIQRVLDGDLYNCTNNSITNAWEFIYKKRYNQEVNWSELYSAIITGTIPGRGNSFEKVFEVMRRKFCAWESEFPTERDKTVEYNYSKKISDDLKAIVEKRGESYEVRYQFFGSQQDAYAYQEALSISPVTVAVEGKYIWKDGVIVNAGNPYSHAVLYLGPKDDKKIVFDSESKQLIAFHKDYKFQFPAVHSIKKNNMITTYKKVGEPTIAVKVEGEEAMMAFADGEVAGGKLFKTLYGVDDYKELPRVSVEEFPYPIEYWITTKKPVQGSEKPMQVPKTFIEKLNYLLTNNMNITRRYPSLGSSANPEKISLTLKSLVPLIVMLVSFFNLDIPETLIDEVVNYIGVIITASFTLYGIARKLYYQFK